VPICTSRDRRLVMMMAPPEAPRWNAHPYRVLFLRHDRAGDMVLSTGVMRAIARSHPGITLDVLASPLNAPDYRGATCRRATPSTSLGSMSRPRSVFVEEARYDAVVHHMVGDDVAARAGERRNIASASRGAATTRRSRSPFLPTRAPTATWWTGSPRSRARSTSISRRWSADRRSTFPRWKSRGPSRCGGRGRTTARACSSTSRRERRSERGPTSGTSR
jgi:hypothetical protein